MGRVWTLSLMWVEVPHSLLLCSVAPRPMPSLVLLQDVAEAADASEIEERSMRDSTSLLLMNAAMNGHVSIVRELLKRGAKVDAQQASPRLAVERFGAQISQCRCIYPRSRVK